jgi:hypothetical protein
MMRTRKAVAAAVLGAALPLYIDAATEPWSGRGVARSWLAGTCKIAVAVAVSWALGEVTGPRAPILELELAGGSDARLPAARLG